MKISNRTRPGRWCALAASLALGGVALAQTPKMTLVGSNVPSDGRQYPHSSSVNNGTLSQVAGAGFKAGKLIVSGTAQNIGYPGSSTKNHSGQMRIMLRNVTKGTSYTTVNLFYNFNLPWTTDSASRTFDASGLGQVDGGDTIEVRFFESYDDSATPDSRWNSVTVQLFARPPATTGYTAIDLIACPCPPVVEDGSDISISLALFDGLGGLVESDSGDAGTAPQVSLDGLPPGEYYVCCVPGISASFDDGFSVTPGPGSATDGVVRLNQGGATMFELEMHGDGDAAWHALEVVDTTCAADVDGDGAVALSDLARILADFGQVCP